MVAADATTNTPVDFITNLGALGIALACIYWLLGRGDRREARLAEEDLAERDKLRADLAAERAAHDHTRKALIEALKGK